MPCNWSISMRRKQGCPNCWNKCSPAKRSPTLIIVAFGALLIEVDVPGQCKQILFVLDQLGLESGFEQVSGFAMLVARIEGVTGIQPLPYTNPPNLQT